MPLPPPHPLLLLPADCSHTVSIGKFKKHSLWIGEVLLLLQRQRRLSLTHWTVCGLSCGEMKGVMNTFYFANIGSSGDQLICKQLAGRSRRIHLD